MKKKRWAVYVLLAVFSFVLSGCGTKMAELTAEEEELIALYAAKAVSKHNLNQEKGVCIVTEDEMDADVGTAGNDDSKGEDADGSAEDLEGAETSDETQSPARISLSEALGVDGVTFQYQGFEIRDTYQSTDYFMMTPNNGYAYLILKVQAVNQQAADVSVDLLAKGASYRVTVNGEIRSMAETTLLLNDLATYQGTFSAGEAKELVLLFQVKSEQLADVTSLGLEIDINGITSNISI